MPGQPAPQAQVQCKGILIFERHAEASGLAPVYRSRCIGTASSSPFDKPVDLAAHHQTRDLPAVDGILAVDTITCLGRAVYQPDAGTQAGTQPPPMCLGLEFARYAQFVSQHSAALAHAHAHSEQARAAALSALPANSFASTSHASSGSDAAPALGPAVRHAHGQQQPAAEAAPRPSRRGLPAARPDGGATGEGPEPRPGLLERLAAARAEAWERLEGQDPLWFAKAFAARAKLNAESMRRMAGEVAAAARADLGWDGTEAEEHE